jgi:hypothetical protein
VLEKLKTIKDVPLTLEFDKTNFFALPETNSLCTITLPDAAGTINFWGDIKDADGGTLGTGSKVISKVIIKVTNRNASGVETAPYAG